MARFAKLRRVGYCQVDLDEVPSDGDEFEAGYFYGENEGDDEAETIPGSPPELRNSIEVIEVVDSESEVDMVKEPLVLLSPLEEQLRMKNEERYGHLHRTAHENERVAIRVKRAIEGQNLETPEQRRLRRRRIQEQIGHS